MENNMETTIVCWGVIGIIGYKLHRGVILGIPITENQMEKKMENEMETGITYGDILGLYRWRRKRKLL